jgi:transcriptional regulator NrdR family protein
MKCPIYNSKDTKVIDSQPSDSNTRIRRRRECQDCWYRWTTREEIVKDEEDKEPETCPTCGSVLEDK